jgi:hypothetical protein
MGRSTPEYDLSLKHRALELRASGLSWPEVREKLHAEVGVAVPARTLAHWGASAEGRAMIAELREQLVATIADRAHSAVPAVYDRLDVAIASGEARDVDMLARALTNLTRGLVADRIEMAPPKGPESIDELASLLARHGVRLGDADTP